VNLCVKAIAGLAVLGVLVSQTGHAETADSGRQIQTPVRDAIGIHQATQKSETQWREERQKMVADFERLQEEKQQLEARHKAMAEGVEAAKVRIAAKQAQLEAIGQIGAHVQPFLDELLAALRRRLDEDLPFLGEERRKRLETLTVLRNDPEVSVSEKARKVFEALLVEAEYGNTIEVYQETITVQGRSILANILRLGRIGLFYQSLDQRACGFYNVAAGVWQPLDNSYNRTLQTAIEIGAKQRPVEILALPIGRMAPR